MACLAISTITAALGGYVSLGIRHAGELVVRTYDESLMSINYARAAATDFAAMRATLPPPGHRRSRAAKTFDQEIAALARTLAEDLSDRGGTIRSRHRLAGTAPGFRRPPTPGARCTNVRCRPSTEAAVQVSATPRSARSITMLRSSTRKLIC